MTRLRTLRLALWSLVGVAAFVALGLWLVGPPSQQQLFADLGRGDYRLATTDGGAFTEASLAADEPTDGPTAVFFGFTHCPEVCPTTLGDIGVWQEELAAAGEAPLRVFFVTVDPERDTPEVLGGYVSWVPEVTGVTGPREEVDEAIQAFRIYARKVPTEDGDYTMDHSASVLLFDREGRFAGTIGYQEEFDRAMAAIRRAAA